MKKTKKLELKRVTVAALASVGGAGFYSKWCSNSCHIDCPPTLGLTNCCDSDVCSVDCGNDSGRFC